MTHRWKIWTSLVCGLCLCLLGCKKDEVDSKAPFKLPGATAVLDHLQKKEYEATVAGLFELKGKVTEQEMPEYRRLREKVLEQLVNEMGDSEPAKEAYRAIGMMERGR